MKFFLDLNNHQLKNIISQLPDEDLAELQQEIEDVREKRAAEHQDGSEQVILDISFAPEAPGLIQKNRSESS